ncbi:MAG: hypothetical protein LBC75_10100 [Fibromonadaceae bacterium]|jgi:hypothetical protein|nr:hypothetical protein [Fibromonadaceae bacterium]
MNTKIKMLLLFCICLIAYSCSCEDCGECENGRCSYYVDEPHYINKSGMSAKIYVRWFSSNAFSYSYGYVQNEDTLHRTFLQYDKLDTTAFILPSVFTASDLIEIQFLENPTNCLIYSGPIQDSLTDMRSLKAYEKGDTIPGVYLYENFVRYFYTITPELRAMAKEEDCQVSD